MTRDLSQVASIRLAAQRSASPAARAWMQAGLWASDPDTLVARPEIPEREEWAAHVESHGGVAFSSDRLAALDERGLELTRRALCPSSTRLP